MNHKKRSTDRVIKQGSHDLGSSKESACVGDSNLPADQEVTTLPLSKLRSHPLQAAFNPDCSEHENAELAADLAIVQRDPIHVMPPRNLADLPAYTILDGHRRCAAMLSNGATTAKVIIRHDLKETDAKTVELMFLRFNQLRRHYDPLAFACSLLRQHEIGEHRERGHISGTGFRDVVRIYAAAMNGMCIRNAQRYMHLARAPMEIQHSYRQGQLDLKLAARVGSLAKDVQETIARRIAVETDSTEIHSIVKKYLSPRASHRPASNTRIAFRMMKKMEQVLLDHQFDYANVHGPTVKRLLPTLIKLKSAVGKLIIAAKAPGSSVEEDYDNCVSSEEAVLKAD